MLAQMRKSAGFSGFYQLPLAQQVILADCLDRANPQINLLASNHHGDHLCRNGWLREEVSIHIGQRSFAVQHLKWIELQGIKSQILTPAMQAEIQAFRHTAKQNPSFSR